MYFCGLIGHQDIRESLSLAYRENRRREGDSVIVIITSVTYPQTGEHGRRVKLETDRQTDRQTATQMEREGSEERNEDGTSSPVWRPDSSACTHTHTHSDTDTHLKQWHTHTHNSTFRSCRQTTTERINRDMNRYRNHSLLSRLLFMSA